MNTDYRYILASNKIPKIDCPFCGGKKHWQRYIDSYTGEVLPEEIGKCDNSDKCGGHNTPKDSGYAKAIWEQEKGNQSEWKPKLFKKKAPEVKKAIEVPFDSKTFEKTLGHYEKNVFIKNLLSNVPFPFAIPEVEKVISLYYLGTRNGAVTFPFINRKNEIRAIQVKQFDKTNHTIGTDFLGAILEGELNPVPEWLDSYQKQDKKITCLFGEHLLAKYPNRPIALVEAPKTAVYGWLYFHDYPPMKDYIWLATGSKGFFTKDRVQVLQGRTVSIFPDLSVNGVTFREWENKAKQFEKELPRTKFLVIDFLESLATEQEREKGFDIADFLIKHDWRQFRERHPQIEKHPQIEPKEVERHPQPKRTSKAPETDWSDEIEELERFFQYTELPKQPVKLKAGTIIQDSTKFINSHLQTVKHNNGNKTFIPYLERLQQFREVLEPDESDTL